MKARLSVALAATSAVIALFSSGSVPASDFKVAPEEDEVPVVAAGPFRRHLLRIAAHPSLNYTNALVDQILGSISQTIEAQDFASDVPCAADFVRDGDVISDSRLVLSGTSDEIVRSLASVAPRANVIVVAQITDCDGGPAAGCAPLIPQMRDAMAVIHDGSARGFIVWLHERGHVKGSVRHARAAVPRSGRGFAFADCRQSVAENRRLVRGRTDTVC
jgi:hypothetical protein